MGRANITREFRDGRYTIEIDQGTGIAEARIEYYNQIIAQQEAKISELEPLLAYYEAQENIAESYLTGSINAYNETEQEDSDKEQLKSAQYLLIRARENTRAVRQRLSIANTTLANAVSKQASLTGISLIQSRTVWCADYTERAVGEVATIEINAEPPVILIAPGADRPTSADGEMIDRRVQSGAQVYFNAALLPGWQKFQPTYRLGYITAIDRPNDLCDVTLDRAFSSAQGLDINLADFLQGIRIDYMTCDSFAFEIGDDVVVKFDGEWTNPKVIGFKERPKSCGKRKLFFIMETHDYDVYYQDGNSGLPEAVHFGGPTPQTKETPFIHCLKTTEVSPGPVLADPTNDTEWGEGRYLPADVARHAYRVRFDTAFAHVPGIYNEETNPDNEYDTFFELFSPPKIRYFEDYPAYRCDWRSAPQYTSKIAGTHGATVTNNEFVLDSITYKESNWPHNEVTRKVFSGTYERLSVSNSGINNTNKQPAIVDREATTDFYLQHWESPPRTIYLEQGTAQDPEIKEWIEYELLWIGPRPDDFFNWETETQWEDIQPVDYVGPPHSVLPYRVGGVTYQEVDR